MFEPRIDCFGLVVIIEVGFGSELGLEISFSVLLHGPPVSVFGHQLQGARSRYFHMCKIIEIIAIFTQYHPSPFATKFRIWYRLSAVLTQSIANAWERSKSRLQSCKHLSKQVILMFHPPLLDSSQPASSVCATYCLKQRQVSLQPSISIELYAALHMPRCRHVPIGSRLKCLDDLRSHTL